MDTNNVQSDSVTEENSEMETQTTDNSTTQDVTSSQDSNSDSDTNSSNEDSSKEEKPFNKEALLSDLHKERTAKKELRSQVESLQAELETAKSASAELQAVQTKYDRLESFLLAAGGPLSKALDSRSFTKALFESDKDIEELVDTWHKENPTQTSVALGSGSGNTEKSADLNALLRSAAR